MPRGRPSIYTDAIAEEICGRIAEGLSIREISALDGMPSERAIWAWVGNNPDFQPRYARAKEHQMERFAEEIVRISDDGTNDWMKRQAGEDDLPNHEHINRSKLRVESRKWLMSKLAPKKYGEKVAVDHSGTVTLEQMLSEVHGKDAK